jgi:peroxiredoxin
VVKKLKAVSLISVFLIVFSLLGCQQNAVTGSAKSLGMAPDFTLNDLNGRPFSFSETRGKVVILDFWATWCPPCREEIPHFVALYRDYRGKGLEIVGVSLDQGGANAVKPFVKANGINYPVVIGNRKVTADYGGIRGIPTTFIIDRKGRIAEKFVGYRDKAVFEKAIKKLL